MQRSMERSFEVPKGGRLYAVSSGEVRHVLERHKGNGDVEMVMNEERK